MSLLAILSYHKIGPPSPGAWETWYYVPKPTFAAHLRVLRDKGWTPIGLDQLLHGLADPSSLPEKSALITFDDGYRSLVRHALPLMRQMHVPGVVFMPTDLVGGINAWDQGVEPEEPLCDWADLRELERGGVAVQSHSATHPHLSSIPRARQVEEMRRSKQEIENNLQRACSTIAFPYGDDDNGNLRIALRDAGYRAAFLYGGPVVTVPITDPYRIPRLALGPDSDLSALLGG